MSVDVLREVFRLSKSKGVARNVLTVLADAAHPDGVTWLPIEPSKGGDPTRCLTHRANASKRAVIDAIQSLVDAGEIEVRRAQRGRRRISVYRVVLGQVAATAVDYSDLPFTLEHPFADEVQNLHVVGSGDEVQFSSPRGANLVDDAPTVRGGFAGDSSSQAVPEASSKPSSPPDGGEGAARAARQRDPIWGILEEKFGRVVAGTNSYGKRLRAAGDLRRFDATPDSVRHALVRWPFVFPGATVTDVALATHFPQLTAGYSGATSAPPRRVPELLAGETTEAAYRRWVTEKAADASFPLFEVFAVIGEWRDLDDVDRQELTTLAERTRESLSTTSEEEAA